MTYEEKFLALQSLTSHCLRMRRVGNWYVDSGLEIKDGAIFSGDYGEGKTPEEAINNHWDIYSKVKLPNTIVVNDYTENRHEYIWNGYMWKEVN